MLRAVAVAAALALLLAACGGNGNGNGGGGKEPARQARQGGTLVVGAEQEPDCLDLYGACSGSSWGFWIGQGQLFPRAFDVVDNRYRASAIMDGEPKLELGTPPKVTYRIRRDAKWSDGQPITSADIAWTWKDITTGKDIFSKIGYANIERVDTPDPQTAVAVFKEPYAAWRDLFSAFFGIAPKHLLEGRDRAKVLSNGFTFSGGPWKLESWRKGQDLTLVPNPTWIGPKPKLDRIVFKFITDSAAELQAFKSGQVDVIYPQQQIGLGPQLRRLPDAKVTTDPHGTQYEGLFLNASRWPLTSKAVRQAVAYSIDRDTIVAQLGKPIDPAAEAMQSWALPNFPQFYEPVYARYRTNPAKVDELMTADGWARGADGVWAKDGRRATLEISTTAGNKGRELVEQLMQNQLGQTGFELRINNTQAGTLFGQWLPKGRHMMGMYAQIATPDPTLCDLFCTKEIPTAANQNSGQNWDFYGTPALDRYWDGSEKAMDDAQLATLIKQANAEMAEEVPAIPMYQKIAILVWRPGKVGGPIGHNTTLGPFWNINEWYLTK